MTEQSLTLYSIETELLELMEFREDLLSGDAYADGEEERRECIQVTEERIAEYIAREVQKVDGIAAMLREFKRREQIELDEADRIVKRARRWKERHAGLEARCIEVMQASGKEKLEGQHNTLALRKNPPAVEIAQPELVPEEYQTITITLPFAMWADFQETYEFSDSREAKMIKLAKVGPPTPMKAEIARVLKSTEPCPKCKGAGVIKPYMADEGEVGKDCDQCGGSGKVPKGVPGCRLVSGVRLEVR